MKAEVGKLYIYTPSNEWYCIIVLCTGKKNIHPRLNVFSGVVVKSKMRGFDADARDKVGYYGTNWAAQDFKEFDGVLTTRKNKPK